MTGVGQDKGLVLSQRRYTAVVKFHDVVKL